MELPLLLYYASIRKEGLVQKEEIAELLHKQLQHPWASCWPGPLGAFVIDELTEDQVRAKAIFKHEIVTRQQTFQVEFYVGVKALAAGDSKAFKSQMKRCNSIAGCEEENEYYLARYEVRS
jgi:hypothetical protein